MTLMDHDSGTCDCGGDVAAYALGALDPEEIEAFRTHLDSCVVCRDELVAFERVVGVLPMGVPQQRAPADLRRRVLEIVEREPKLDSPVDPRRRRRPRSTRLSVPRLGLALGAAVAILAIAIAAVELGTSATTKSRVFTAQVSGPGTADLTVAGDHGQLIVRHFSPPPAGQIYEVWLGRPGRSPAPTTALFSVTANGDADVEVPGNLRGVTIVMVTPEPAGGTSTPTHPPVIRAQLS